MPLLGIYILNFGKYLVKFSDLGLHTRPCTAGGEMPNRPILATYRGKRPHNCLTNYQQHCIACSRADNKISPRGRRDSMHPPMAV